MFAACALAALSLVQVPQDASPKLAPETVVARVGEVELTALDLQREVNRLIPVNYFHNRVPPERVAELQREALDSLVEKTLIRLDALDRGLAPTEQEIRAEFRRTLDTVGGETAKTKGERFDMLLEQYRDLIVKRVLLDKSEARFAASLTPVTDEETHELFEARKDTLFSPEVARFRHILIKVAPEAGAGEAEALFAKMKEVQAQLEAGAEFADLAMEYSEDVYASVGGDMGFVERGAFRSKLVDEKAFALEDGQSSEILSSLYGYHLVQRLESRERRPLTFEEAVPALRAELEEARRVRERAHWLDGVRAAHEVQVLVEVPVAVPTEAHR